MTKGSKIGIGMLVMIVLSAIAYKLFGRTKKESTMLFGSSPDSNAKFPTLKRIDVKTDGSKTSPYNKMKAGSRYTGLNCEPHAGFFNGIEFKFVLEPHLNLSNYIFDIKRMINFHFVAFKVNNKWIHNGDFNKPDDKKNTDEYNEITYINNENFIFSYDAPGYYFYDILAHEQKFHGLEMIFSYVNFTEYLQITDKNNIHISKTDKLKQKWHSIITLKKQNNKWHIYKEGMNKIAIGHTKHIKYE